MIGLTFFSFSLEILFYLEEPYLVINAWGVLVTSISIVTLFFCLKLILQFLSEWKEWKKNIIYILWICGILNFLVQVPYYYLTDITRSYNVFQDKMSQELWKDVRCFFWADERCVVGKKCLKWEGEKCVLCIDEESFIRQNQNCEGAE